MHSAEGVPDAVVAVISITLIVMNLLVKAKVFAVYAIVVHTGSSAVYRSVEDALTRFVSALYADFPQNFVPCGLALC